jgi:hypothetical protein
MYSATFEGQVDMGRIEIVDIVENFGQHYPLFITAGATRFVSDAF